MVFVATALQWIAAGSAVGVGSSLLREALRCDGQEARLTAASLRASISPQHPTPLSLATAAEINFLRKFLSAAFAARAFTETHFSISLPSQKNQRVDLLSLSSVFGSAGTERAGLAGQDDLGAQGSRSEAGFLPVAAKSFPEQRRAAPPDNRAAVHRSPMAQQSQQLTKAIY